MKKLFFLSGLPRTGSTLLASILNQHPDIYASGTSPLMDLLCLTDRSINSLRSQYIIDDTEQEQNIYRGILLSFYENKPQNHIFDKHRGWPRNCSTLKRFFKDPKIIATVRPIDEIITSYITLIQKHPGEKNFIDRKLLVDRMPLTTENRAHLIWEGYVQDPYQSLITGLRDHKKNHLLISYSSLISKPYETLNKIFDFTGIPKFDDFRFESIQNKIQEKDDEGWGLPELHDIRPKLESQSQKPETVLGPTLSQYFRQFDIPID